MDADYTFTVVYQNTSQETNVALSVNGAIATAISEGTYLGNTQHANYAIDGNENTSWASEYSMPAWITVSFNKIYNIDKVGVFISTHQQTFSISLSTDNVNWATVVLPKLSTNQEGLGSDYEIFSIPNTKAQYLKVDITTTSAPPTHIFQAVIAEIEAFTQDNITDVRNSTSEIPSSFILYQNYPNPFNPSTTIKFSVPSVGRNGISTYMVVLKIYDVLGREVATLVNGEKSPGNYEVVFDGSNLPSGIYFYRISAGNFSETKKLALMK